MAGMTGDLEERVLQALTAAGPSSAREVAERLGLRGHDVSKLLGDLAARGVLSVRPRDPARPADHTNPRVFARNLDSLT